MPHLKLFGGAIVEDESGVVSSLSSRRHSVALLALLATAPSRTLSRGKLVGYLWPDSPEKTARNRLTSCLYQLRSELGEEAVLSVGGDLRFNAEVLTCDVSRFEEALEAEGCERAAELYEGAFLDGFWLRDSPEFDQWMERERDRLRRGYHEALEALARRAEERGELETAAGWWRKRAVEDPFDSRVAGRLVEAVAVAGNRAEALRSAREHARLLEEEFGMEPDAELQALVAAIQTPAPPHEPVAGDGAVSKDGADKAVPRSAEPDFCAIAVLPFESIGAGDDASAFAHGLHHDLLTRLSRAAALTVISRTSVLRYRDTERSVPEIARELGVGTVVEGGVQSAAGRLRLNVQLIDARSDALRWAETYDRELTAQNLFDIQSELAEKITGSLQATLTPEERERVGKTPTDSLDAYLLYTRGRSQLAQRTERGMRQAIDYFRRAIHEDPGYALAWAGVSEAVLLLGGYGYPVPEDVLDPRSAARRAVELSPDLGEAHASLGILHATRQEGPAAIRSLERAIELQPSCAEAYNWLGWLRMILGCPAEAIRPAERAAELDPLAPYVRAFLGMIYLADGYLEKALREARSARKLQPEYGIPHFVEGLALFHRGRFPEAAVSLEETLSLAIPHGTPSQPEVWAVLTAARAAGGDRRGAQELLSRIRKAGDPFAVGLANAALGEHEAALAAFESVQRWGSIATPLFRYCFPDVLGPLRRDPRHATLLRQVERSWGLEDGDGGVSS